jgi:phage N-6-adenine-methyltransferase
MHNRGYYTSPHGASNCEWYTPADIIERARWVMHGIDLDPFSSDEAQRTVQASHYFTAQSDGIASPWPTVQSVWVNPPYGKGLIDPCISKVISAYHAGTFQTGIVLINNATETVWFHALARICMGGCMFARRIDFVDGSRGGMAKNKNTRGQIALYIGDEQRRFDEAFRKLGRCFDLT